MYIVDIHTYFMLGGCRSTEGRDCCRTPKNTGRVPGRKEKQHCTRDIQDRVHIRQFTGSPHRCESADCSPIVYLTID